MKKQTDYDTWRINKIDEIKEAHDCSYAEATMIFLLQDIAYKLSTHYEATVARNAPPKGAVNRKKEKA